MQRYADRLVVLIGARPTDGWRALRRMGVPFVLVTDETEGDLYRDAGALAVHRVPFKTDPTAVLDLDLPPKVDAVLSFTEFGLLPAALLNDAIGGPGVSTGAVLRTRSKLLMRRALGDDVAQPAYGVVGSRGPGPADFPVVAKPVDGSGSRSVEMVPDQETYRRREATLRGYLWESYIGGEEYSVEAVTVDGTHQVLGVTEKVTTGAPRFIEVAHHTPAPVPPDVAEEIQRCVTTALTRLGVTAGASHTEVKVDRGRAVLIETHTRPGGDRIPRITELVCGHDQYELAVRSVLDPASPFPPPPTPRRAASGIRYFPWEDVVLDAVDGLDECAGLDGVAEVELLATCGQPIPVWQYSHDRPGYVIACADSGAQLQRTLTEAVALVAPVLRPRDHGAPPPSALDTRPFAAAG